MTAFNEILTAEEEALKSIETAKEEVAEAISKAKAERKTRLETESVALNEQEANELSTHAEKIKAITDKIHSDVEVKVSAVEKKFTEHASNLKDTLKKSFA